jgi:uncharacterized protein
MKKQITLQDLDNLALGAALLGSGGGGNPHYELMVARYYLERSGPVSLIALEDLTPSDIVVPVAFMGAPLISLEKISNGTEFLTIFSLIERFLGKKPTALMAAEIGGANAFTPLIVSCMTGLPVVDADLLGRAFPELQMSSANLYNVPAAPAFIADTLGNATIITTDSSFTLESVARAITVAYGSSAALAAYIMDGSQAQRATVSGTVTQALGLGSLITQARAQKQDPLAALVAHGQAQLIGEGTIVDINQEIKNGFLCGSVTIKNEQQELTLEYRNENLLARIGDTVIATTPDIIIPLDSQTGTPLTSESLAYGIKVGVVVVPAPALWQTNEGLGLVGPRCFGYEIDYKPYGEII